LLCGAHFFTILFFAFYSDSAVAVAKNSVRWVEKEPQALILRKFIANSLRESEAEDLNDFTQKL
jgi:23S rRNA maturation mini-RNase III